MKKYKLLESVELRWHVSLLDAPFALYNSCNFQCQDYYLMSGKEPVARSAAYFTEAASAMPGPKASINFV